MKLTPADYAALHRARKGNQAVDDIPEKAGLDLWNCPIPGKRTYDKLEKLGLLILTEEEPILLEGMEEPFTFTAFVELTKEGENALKTEHKQPS